jgi:hypothetical protein
MARQNRATPFATIEAADARGSLMGNRGILHDERGELGTARWRHPHWVTCLLEFKARWRPVMAPHAYTELFFLDEAVAFAAGHRPCAECRREDYLRLGRAWRAGNGLPADWQIRAVDIDRLLHAERIAGRGQKTYAAALAELPDGSFIRMTAEPREAWVIAGAKILRWRHGGYDRARGRPSLTVEVLTPRPSVAAFTAGYRPALHESARHLL